MLHPNCSLMADIYFPMLTQKYSDDKWQGIDLAFMALNLVGLICSVYIIKRGLWKLRHIDTNRNLIKDEAWKDIHMTIPRRIVTFTIISMCVYIFYQSIFIIRGAMM